MSAKALQRGMGMNGSSRLESCYRLIALLFALAGIVYWQTLQQGDENEEIDIMLLADDLADKRLSRRRVRCMARSALAIVFWLMFFTFRRRLVRPSPPGRN